MSLSILKLQNFNNERKRNQTAVADSLSRLHSQATLTLKQQAYMHLNPDANGADELIAESKPTFDALAAEFNTIALILQDSQAVSAGTMTAAELISKYNLDMTEFSNGLV